MGRLMEFLKFGIEQGITSVDKVAANSATDDPKIQRVKSKSPQVGMAHIAGVDVPGIVDMSWVVVAVVVVVLAVVVVVDSVVDIVVVVGGPPRGSRVD